MAHTVTQQPLSICPRGTPLYMHKDFNCRTIFTVENWEPPRSSAWGMAKQPWQRHEWNVMCVVVTRMSQLECPNTEKCPSQKDKLKKHPCRLLYVKKLKPQKSIMYFLWAHGHGCREKAWKERKAGESVGHFGNWGPGVYRGHSTQPGRWGHAL